MSSYVAAQVGALLEACYTRLAVAKVTKRRRRKRKRRRKRRRRGIIIFVVVANDEERNVDCVHSLVPQRARQRCAVVGWCARRWSMCGKEEKVYQVH